MQAHNRIVEEVHNELVTRESEARKRVNEYPSDLAVDMLGKNPRDKTIRDILALSKMQMDKIEEEGSDERPLYDEHEW